MRYKLLNHIVAFVFLLPCVHSCKGPDQPAEHNSYDTIPVKPGSPKLIKTQGSAVSEEVRCMLEDKHHNLWFGTTGDGVYKYDGNLFTQYTKKDGLSSNTVYSLMEDQAGNIWFGTDAGLTKYDGKSFSFVPLTVINGNKFYAGSNSNNESLKNTVWSMLQDKTGKIWFGTSDGVYILDGKQFSDFPDNRRVINKEELRLKMVDDILEDPNGHIWFASGMPPGEEGVILFDGKTLTPFKPTGDGWIRYMTADKNSRIWFAGRSHGNFVYDGKGFKPFAGQPGTGNAMLADKNGNIWFSGEENNAMENIGGIWSYDGKIFRNYGVKDGMGKYFVWSMLEDSKGNIWFGTRNTGLYKYDGHTFTSFSE